MAGLGFDDEPLQIGAPELDAGIGWGRQEPQIDLNTRVKTYTRNGDRSSKGLLVSQIVLRRRNIEQLSGHSPKVGVVASRQRVRRV
jgi:hypothetical protein